MRLGYIYIHYMHSIAQLDHCNDPLRTTTRLLGILRQPQVAAVMCQSTYCTVLAPSSPADLSSPSFSRLALTPTYTLSIHTCSACFRSLSSTRDAECLPLAPRIACIISSLACTSSCAESEWKSLSMSSRSLPLPCQLGVLWPLPLTGLSLPPPLRSINTYLVSGQKNHVQKPDSTDHAPKNTNVPYPIPCTIGGVMSPMMKLKPQFAHVVIATPLARRLEDWTSAAARQPYPTPLLIQNCLPGDSRRAQGTGDHPRPKQNMNTRMKPTPTHASLGCASQL